jgi:hypothetical protein
MELTALRRRVGAMCLGLLWLLVLADAVVASPNDPTRAMLGLRAAAATAVLATLVGGFGLGAAVARSLYAVAMSFSVAVLIWLAPPPLRGDLQMLPLVVLTVTAGFGDPWPILLASAATVGTHLGLAELIASLQVVPVRGVVEAAVLVSQTCVLLLVAGFIRRSGRQSEDPIDLASLQGLFAEPMDPAPPPPPDVTLSELLQKAAAAADPAAEPATATLVAATETGLSNTERIIEAVEKLAVSIEAINRSVHRAVAV